MALKELLNDIDSQKNAVKAKIFSRFFKTKKGEYGEGDLFLGLNVPEQRILAKKHIDLNLKDIQFLLNSKFHEHRLTGLMILVYKYENISKQIKQSKQTKQRILKQNKTNHAKQIFKEKKSNNKEHQHDIKQISQKEIFNFYLKNTKKINNWDLVDVTCAHIVGDYLKDKNRQLLYRLAKSNNLWQRRIAIVSTHTFIKNKDFKDTLAISEILLKDDHDLIHKAVGWMLREVGKKDEKALKKFLNKYYKIMPRTMLRYSIERLNAHDKIFYMKKP